MSECYLRLIVVLLVALVAVLVVPGPFVHCESRDTGLTAPDALGNERPVRAIDCRDTWWPVGAARIGWLPETRPAPDPGASPFAFPTAPPLAIPSRAPAPATLNLWTPEPTTIELEDYAP